MFWLYAILLFLFAASTEWLSVLWHRARENLRLKLGLVATTLLEIVAWLTLLLVVFDSVWLIVPAMVGNAVGTYLSFADEALSKKPGDRLYGHDLCYGPGARILKRIYSFTNKILSIKKIG